ncbi:MAG: DUF4038 domain-containing protein [Pyrinomonadaceae bacterium]
MDGERPFDSKDDILKPNEAYWRYFDEVVQAAQSRDLLVAIAPIWIRWGGNDKHGWRSQLNDQNARPYGRFLGQRYRNFKNIIWILGGDANPIERTRAVAEIARGSTGDCAAIQLITGAHVARTIPAARSLRASRGSAL